MTIPFIKELIMDGLSGKIKAIHAYDSMIWTVRSGFLTLVFAAWGLAIKTAMENKLLIHEINGYALLLSGFTVVLAIGGYCIDINYAKRKFRVITSVNQLKRIVVRPEGTPFSPIEIEQLRELLMISGDSTSVSYQSTQYRNEYKISLIVYLSPIVLIIGLLILLF